MNIKEHISKTNAKAGRIGGLNGKGEDYRLGGWRAKGFANNPKLASTAGRKGGLASAKIRRRKHER